MKFQIFGCRSALTWFQLTTKTGA